MISAKRKPSNITVAAQACIYAIGDVHGEIELLNALLDEIRKDMADRITRSDKQRIIFLGDIIDRGPKSLFCLQRVYEELRDHRAELILGNHEDLLLRTMRGDPQAQSTWIKHGGETTLKSLGLAVPKKEEDSFSFAQRVTKAMPDHLLKMLEAAPYFTKSGDYFFCHAGVRPGVALHKQEDFDLMFIRDEFITSNDWHGARIVHGHSIVEDVDIRDNRIAVDTGAYRTGRLSCVRLQGNDAETLSVQRHADGSIGIEKANS